MQEGMHTGLYGFQGDNLVLTAGRCPPDKLFQNQVNCCCLICELEQNYLMHSSFPFHRPPPTLCHRCGWKGPGAMEGNGVTEEGALDQVGLCRSL